MASCHGIGRDPARLHFWLFPPVLQGGVEANVGGAGMSRCWCALAVSTSKYSGFVSSAEWAKFDTGPRSTTTIDAPSGGPWASSPERLFHVRRVRGDPASP